MGNALSLGKQKPPKAPDVIGAAQATAEGNAKAARAAAAGNRVNQAGPWGSLTYNQTGTDAEGNPLYTATQSLPGGIGSGLESLFANIGENIGQGIDTSQLPQQQINPGQTAQDAIMSRLTPQFDRRQQQLETQLANQGIAPGTEAWKNSFSDFNNARTDAETQAALQGINVGQNARQQALQEQSFLRSEPINLMQALKSGTQITPYSGGGQQYTPGADILGATMGDYQNQLGSVNAQNAQMGNLANTGLMAYGMYAF